MKQTTPPRSYWNAGQSFLVVSPHHTWESLADTARAVFAVSPFDIVRGGEAGKLLAEEARDLRHTAYRGPTQGPLLLIIIYHCDTCSDEAATTLLKVLEEPPATTRFLLLSATRHILPTIRSRCTFWTDPHHTIAEPKTDPIIALDPNSNFATVSSKLAAAVKDGEAAAIIDQWSESILQSKSPPKEALQWLVEARHIATNTATNPQALLELTFLFLVHQHSLPLFLKQSYTQRHHGHT